MASFEDQDDSNENEHGEGGCGKQTKEDEITVVTHQALQIVEQEMRPLLIRWISQMLQEMRQTIRQ